MTLYRVKRLLEYQKKKENNSPRFLKTMKCFIYDYKIIGFPHSLRFLRANLMLIVFKYTKLMYIIKLIGII